MTTLGNLSRLISRVTYDAPNITGYVNVATNVAGCPYRFPIAELFEDYTQ